MAATWSMLRTRARGRLRLDPRGKMLAFGALIVATLAAPGYPALLLFFATAGLVAALEGVARPWLRVFRGLIWLVGLVVVFNVLYYGWYVGVLAGGRFLLAVAVFSLLFLTTPPEDLALALTRLGAPYSLGFSISAGMRFIPTVAQELADIGDAYRARGVEVDASPIGRFRALATVLVPLVVATIARSLRLAEAMEARGFGYTPHRTSLRTLAFRWHDVAFLAAIAGVVAAALLVFPRVA